MNLKVTLAMLMCGIGAAAAAGVASAGTTDVEVSTLAVKYNPAALDTDGGARLLYTRIAKAAAAVCPSSDPFFVNAAVRACREHAIETAVEKVHNERLAAVYLSSSKHG